MVGTLLMRGMLVGVLAGIFAFAFARVYGEPRIEQAIAFEDQMTHATDAAHDHAVEEVVSRQTQAGLGLFSGLIAYGAALGGLFALVFALLHGRLGPSNPQMLAIAIASAGFVALTFVPGLKYPGNPPAVGDGGTIAQRTILFFGMIAISIVAAAVGIQVARLIRQSAGPGAAWAAGISAYAAIAAAAFLVLPAVNEVPQGFSAELLWQFRMTSLAMHAILWCTLGIAFGLWVKFSSGSDSAGARLWQHR
ncbi:CbtA family protein [Mesorhizobium argentiipisi]|uniref:CbtA family protein n=1 Tax=Mesorhizobium argentiipisi TaxID=3015175 RepID=A0ABU8KL53_9HYPH